jgi:hypothetical protein
MSLIDIGCCYEVAPSFSSSHRFAPEHRFSRLTMRLNLAKNDAGRHNKSSQQGSLFKSRNVVTELSSPVAVEMEKWRGLESQGGSQQTVPVLMNHDRYLKKGSAAYGIFQQLSNRHSPTHLHRVSHLHRGITSRGWRALSREAEYY